MSRTSLLSVLSSLSFFSSFPFIYIFLFIIFFLDLDFLFLLSRLFPHTTCQLWYGRRSNSWSSVGVIGLFVFCSQPVTVGCTLLCSQFTIKEVSLLWCHAKVFRFHLSAWRSVLGMVHTLRNLKLYSFLFVNNVRVQVWGTFASANSHSFVLLCHFGLQ
jgi:hypothetical protein